MPVPVQAFFVADRVKVLAAEHPEWRTTEPFKSQLAGDVQSVMAQGLDFFDDKAGKPVAINKFITDAEREFAYDRGRVPSGQLDRGLNEAPGYGWVLADMKDDWNRVFPP